MRVVCVSDTHGLHAALQEASPIPYGDVFIHAGDFTDTGARDEVLAFNAWLGTLPHKYKLVIAGNHESTFDREFYPHNWHNYGHAQQFNPTEVRALLTNALYLEDQAVFIDGFLFYGSPWQPEFCNWAFNLPRGAKLVEKWKLIPSDVDVLVTHTPPMGRGDQVGHLRVGCSDLLHEVQTRIKPPFHVFGHVHEGYGRSSDGVTTFLNASSCTHEYEAVNPPMMIELKTPRAVHDIVTNQAIRYDVLLHEQLRVCSQKPAFVPAPNASMNTTNGKRAHPRGPCHSLHDATGRKHSLKEFSVDGTTAAMLFESTLKLRPVKANQTRALRYLFHHGFKGGEAEAAAVRDGQLVEDGEEGTVAANAEAMGESANGSEERMRERRRVSLSRRVTMAVLEELPDSTRDAIAPTPAALMTSEVSNTTEGAASTTGSKTQRRGRRDKTLHRREAVAKLATMVEEPEKEAAAAAEAQASLATDTHSSAASAMAISTSQQGGPDNRDKFDAASNTSQPQEATLGPPEPMSVETPPEPTPPPVPAKECIMCKYKVSGHVHPPSDNGAQASMSLPATGVPATVSVVNATATPARAAEVKPVAPSTAPAPPAAECILCKYKVAGHVHPGAESSPRANGSEDMIEDGGGEKEESVDTETTSRTRGVGPKRLSSWF